MWTADPALRRWPRPTVTDDDRGMIEPLAPAAPTTAPITPIRVVVVDADRRVRSAIGTLLGLAEGLELTGSVGHVAAALAVLESTPVDVLLVDPKLPDVADGLGLVGVVRARWPGTRIVVLTWSDSLEALALDTGVDRYLPKTVGPADLVAAVEAAGRAMPPTGATGGPAARALQ
jgi:DNA-binding NarL/FixJ family response regulator